jgi:hypothetical protein
MQLLDIIIKECNMKNATRYFISKFTNTNNQQKAKVIKKVIRSAVLL